MASTGITRRKSQAAYFVLKIHETLVATLYIWEIVWQQHEESSTRTCQESGLVEGPGDKVKINNAGGSDRVASTTRGKSYPACSAAKVEGPSPGSLEVAGSAIICLCVGVL